MTPTNPFIIPNIPPGPERRCVDCGRLGTTLRCQDCSASWVVDGPRKGGAK